MQRLPVFRQYCEKHLRSVYERKRSHDKLWPLAVAYDLKEDFFCIYDDNPESKDNAISNGNTHLPNFFFESNQIQEDEFDDSEEDDRYENDFVDIETGEIIAPDELDTF